MMKDWIKNILGKPKAPKRYKVHVDMRFEEHSFKSNHILDPVKLNSIKRNESDIESVSGLNSQENTVIIHDKKSTK